MLVKIKNLTGRTYDLDVEPTDTVLKVKQLVEQKEGISPEQQRLIFNAKPLFVVAARARTLFRNGTLTLWVHALCCHSEDERTLRDSNVTAGATLHLVLTLRG